MAAWDDRMTWSERDERLDFDGTTGDYTDWTLAGDPELAALRGLREALVDFRRLLDEFVRAAAA